MIIEKGERIRPFELNYMHGRKILVEFNNIDVLDELKEEKVYFDNCLICFVNGNTIQPEYSTEQFAFHNNIISRFYEIRWCDNNEYRKN